MNKLRDRVGSTTAATLLFGVALALVVISCASQSESPVAPSGSGGRLAQDPAPTPLPPTPTPTPTATPTPTPGNCSPGYYKNHSPEAKGNQENTWYGIGFGFCDGAGQPLCADLLDDLQAGGQTAQDAAAYLNSVTHFTCDEDED